MANQCAACRHARSNGELDGRRWYKCHRYPPQFAGGLFVWPDVPGYGECGEYKRVATRATGGKTDATDYSAR